MKKSVDDICTFSNPYYDKQKPAEDQMDYGQAWPDRDFFSIRHKKPKLGAGVWFIDLEGSTVVKASCLADAKLVLKELKQHNPGAVVELRYWEESEEMAEQAYQARRARLWNHQIYKP